MKPILLPSALDANVDAIDNIKEQSPVLDTIFTNIRRGLYSQADLYIREMALIALKLLVD